MPTPLDSAGLARLPTDVAEIFQEVQESAINHQKNCVKLFKIHDSAQATFKEFEGGEKRLTGGHAFEKAFLQCLCTTLLHDDPKSDALIKLVVKFTGAYFEFVNKRASNEYKCQVERDEIVEETPESVEMGRALIPGFKFTACMLREFVFRGLKASKEPVRYRVLQFLSEMVRSVRYVLSDHHEDLETALIQQLGITEQEKKPRSRPLVAICLVQLSAVAQACDSPSQDAFAELLSPNEPTAVLKAVLSDISLNAAFVPNLLKLARHEDTQVRKVVYAIFAKHVEEEDGEGGKKPGPTHPTNLSIEIMERLVETGLQDREGAVKRAAVALVDSWIAAFEQEPTEDAAISLLRLFGVHKRNSVQTRVVEVLIGGIFEARKDLLQTFSFEEPAYWRLLGAEKAILSRVLFDLLRKTDEELLYEVLPSTANMAGDIRFRLQRLVEIYDACDSGDAVSQDDRARQEVTLRELLTVAATLNYTDSDYGQEQMTVVMRGVLEEHRLPADVLPACIDVLLAAMPNPNRKEVVHTVAQIVRGFLLESPENREDQNLLDAVHEWCLKMSVCMLENVDKICDLEQASALDFIFKRVVQPNTANRRNEALMRDALTCETLLALIKRSVAPEVFYRNWTRLEKEGVDTAIETKTLLYKSVFDLLSVYGPSLLSNPEVPLEWRPVIQGIAKQVDDAADRDVLLVLCHGFVKMILKDLVEDVELEDAIMRKLFIIWVDPAHKDPPELKQVISLFLDRCACQSSQTQRHLQRLFVGAFREAGVVRKRHGRKEKVVGSGDLCEYFRERTDPRNLVKHLRERNEATERVYFSVQLDLLHDILKELFEKEYKLKNEDKRELYKLLPRLYLPDDPNEMEVVDLGILCDRLKQYRPPADKTSEDALHDFEKAFSKKYNIQLGAMDEDDYREMEEHKALFDFLDDIFADEDSDSMVGAQVGPYDGPITRSRKRRSLAIAADSQDESVGPKSKRPRVSSPRSTPISSRSAVSEEREEDIDAELSRLLSHGMRLSTTTAFSSGSTIQDVTQDSIFSDSEDDEAEVSFILAE